MNILKEKENLENLMEQAYKISINSTLADSVRIEAMKAYAKLSLARHNMKYC